MTTVTRFAPSPTGPLHLGHAFSAFVAHDLAQKSNGIFHLRIEDIDRTRARPHWEQAIYDDLHWLGLDWPRPVMRQSDRTEVYFEALQRLWQDGLLYPCSCSRRDIEAAAQAPQEGAEATHGPDGLIYPGTCRHKSRTTRAPLPRQTALRLDMCAAMSRLGLDTIRYTETGSGRDEDMVRPARHLVDHVGDVVLSRRDHLGSYHISVVLDDAAQGVTHVVRGNDLAEATWIHRVLQELLDLPQPLYHHHRLIRDEDGRRLAKRDDARAIATYRAAGWTPRQIRKAVGL